MCLNFDCDCEFFLNQECNMSVELPTTGCGDGICHKCLNKRLGQISGGKIHHRGQAILGMCNLLVLEVARCKRMATGCRCSLRHLVSH